VTPATHPPHLACLLCDPGTEFFTFYGLYVHYYRQHPLVMRPTLCTCGHDEGAHNPAPTKRHCQSGDYRGPCRCVGYEQQGAA
jgi:hypothetical protein